MSEYSSKQREHFYNKKKADTHTKTKRKAKRNRKSTPLVKPITGTYTILHNIYVIARVDENK
jgi:hypothetical protein